MKRDLSQVMDDASSHFHSLDDFAASSTLITFDHPVPLLRGPLRATLPDHPCPAPFVLAFRDLRAWQSAYRACHSKILRQCEHGARNGCAISASNKCKPPWWWKRMGWKRGFDLTERTRCEELEMEACLVAAKDKCVGFADDKCLKPFRDARVALSESKAREKKARKWVHWASIANFGFLPNIIELDRNSPQSSSGFTHFLASELLRSNKSLAKVLSEGEGTAIK